MDIVHHALIGGIGYMALSANNQELAGMAFVAGSVLPDLDVVFMVFGKRFYLRNHQGSTHSLFLSPLLALLIISPVHMLIGGKWTVYAAALLGLWLHYLLDIINTYGVALFWPFKHKKLSLDLLFFIDSVTLSITIAYYIQALTFPISNAIYIYTSSFAAYVLFKYFLHKKVIRDLKCAYAIPSSINPFSYYILCIGSGAVRTFVYNTLSCKLYNETTYLPPRGKYAEMAETSEVFRDMRDIAKFYFITDISSDEKGTEITGQDIGLRNFGGHFGKTVLKFDENNELIDAMAHI